MKFEQKILGQPILQSSEIINADILNSAYEAAKNDALSKVRHHLSYVLKLIKIKQKYMEKSTNFFWLIRLVWRRECGFR